MNKRLLALLMSLTFVLSMSVSAFATNYDEDVATKTTQTSLATTVSGSGTVTYIDTEVYDVVVPTDKIFNFKLDPQGLLTGVVSGAGTELGDLEGGKIIGNENPAPFINNSSVPIVLTVSAQAILTNDDDVAFEATATTVGALKATTANSIALYVVPSTTNMKLTSPDATDYGYSMASEGFLIASENAVELKFALDRAKYNVYTSGASTGFVGGNETFEDYYIELVTNSGCGSALTIGGIINPNADWKDFTGDTPTKGIKVELVFEYTQDSSHATQDTTNSIKAYGLISDAALIALKTMPAEGVGVKYDKTGFVVTSGSTLAVQSSTTLSLTAANGWDRTAASTYSIPFYLNTGETITNIYWSTTGTTELLGTDVSYVKSKATLQLNGSGATVGVSSASTTGTKTIRILVKNAAGTTTTYTANFYITK